MKITLAVALVALLIAPVAGATVSPLVPLNQQAQMKRVLGQFGLGPLAFVPTKAPSKYTFQATAMNSTQNVISFERGTSVAYFTIAFLKAKLSACGKGSILKLNVDGVMLFSKGYVVWRCVVAGGKVVKMAGQGEGMSRADLGTIVASARPISRLVP